MQAPVSCENIDQRERGQRVIICQGAGTLSFPEG
jgi:hypothetical protein